LNKINKKIKVNSSSKNNKCISRRTLILIKPVKTNIIKISHHISSIIKEIEKDVEYLIKGIETININKNIKKVNKINKKIE